MIKNCKHLNARINGNETIGNATCPSCQQEVFLDEVFNNWLKVFRILAKKQIKEEMKIQNSYDIREHDDFFTNRKLMKVIRRIGGKTESLRIKDAEWVSLEGGRPAEICDLGPLLGPL